MKTIRLISASLMAAILIAACAPTPKSLFLMPETTGLANSSASGAECVFKGKTFTASARQVRANDVSDAFLAGLLMKRYTIISMTIENRSGTTVIYKPNYTALTNSVDYLKPLDYTDIYQMDWDAADRLRRSFFDLDVTIPPGTSATGLLIFTPLSEDARGASIEARELYVGTETTSFTLPFKLKADPS